MVIPYLDGGTLSYDMTIRSDASFSRSVSTRPLIEYLRTLPGVVPNGDCGFALDDRPRRWMEIDLEAVNEEGDSIEGSLADRPAINCIRLHIPYAYLKSSTLNEGFLPLAFKIADHLKWELYDEQSGEPYR
jgi:hypothetical protein